MCHVSQVLHGLGKLKLGKTLAENAENAERFGQAKAWFYLLAENAENADFTIPFQ